MPEEELVILDEDTDMTVEEDKLDLEELEKSLEEELEKGTEEVEEIDLEESTVDLFEEDDEEEKEASEKEVDLEEENDLEVDETEEEKAVEVVEEEKTETLDLFEESEITTPKLTLGKKQDKANETVEDKNTFNTTLSSDSLIHSILKSLVDGTMEDSDFEALCKLKKYNPETVAKRGVDVGLDKRLILYGLVNKGMGVPYEKQQGEYEKQGLGVIDELVNRLQTNQPSLSDTEYNEFCTFLGVQQKAIDDRAKSLWLNRELVLLGVLKLSIKGV